MVVNIENLFSYGTLQQEKVQMDNFERLLHGTEDVLQKYRVEEIEITNKKVLESSNKRFHPILFFTGNSEDEVSGIVFQITSSELLQADSYEVDDYKRVQVSLKSGIRSWIYTRKNEETQP
jgi:gamma-glutamylcyclotransferase (GGCT)/AIG2-like uncharacterized protein YtfP